MSVSNLKKIGLVIIVLVAFFIYLKFNDYKAKHFKVDAKSFHVKTSKAALLNDDFSVMPLLEPANRFHIMMDENVDVPLVNMRRTLHIEKAWLNEGFLYVLYSIDLKNTDKTLADVPKLSFSKIQLHFNNGKTVNVTTSDVQLGKTPSSRLTYNYRVYDELFCGIQLTPQDLLNATSSKAFLNNLKKIDKVTILDPMIELKNHKTSIRSITFPIKLNQDKYYVGSNPINKEINVKGATIQFEKVKNYFDHKELEYKISNNKNHIVSLEFSLNADGGSDPSQPDTYTSELDFDNHTTFVVNSNHVKISPEKVTYKLGKTIKMKISPKVFKQLLNTDKETKVADVLNGQIYFGFDRPYNPDSFYLGFKKDLNKELQFAYPSFLPKNQDTSMPKTVINHSTLISFTSLDGKPINWDTSNGSSSIEGEGEMKIFFSMDHMDNLDKGFTIELDGLMYEEPVDIKPFMISLK